MRSFVIETKKQSIMKTLKTKISDKLHYDEERLEKMEGFIYHTLVTLSIVASGLIFSVGLT